ncbi:MAG: Ig-like domain-containing protein [Lachnospiraceae bacterium]
MIGSTPDLTLLAGTEGGSTGAEHTYAYGSSESATTNNYINAGEWIANAYTVEANTDSTMNVQKLQSVAFALDKRAQYGDSTQHIKSADYQIDIYKYKPTEEAADVLTAGTPAATLTGTYEADKCTDGTTYYSVDLADQGKSVVLGNGECFAVKVTLSNAFSKADDGTAETPATQIHYESSNDNGAVSFANGKRLTNRAVHIKAVTVEGTQEIPIEGVQFTQNSLTLVEGEEQQLTVDYTPATTSQRGLKWESDDKSVVTVDDNGKVTAVAAGNANVTVKSAVDDHISDTIVIEVCKDIANLTYSVISDQTYQGVRIRTDI